MSTQDNLTEAAQPDANQLDAAGARTAVGSPDAISLAALNQLLGKEFKDTATAMQSLKDTQSFVGRRLEAVVQQPTDVASKSDVQALQNQLFYATNPQYKDYADLIASMGGNPAEVVQKDTFKTVFEKVKAADEVTGTQSVVSSNARLAQTKSVTDEAIAVANSRGNTVEDVATTLARGIQAEIAG